jgi:hypothetical protein
MSSYLLLICAGIAGLAVERARRNTQKLDGEIERLEREVHKKRREMLNR